MAIKRNYAMHPKIQWSLKLKLKRNWQCNRKRKEKKEKGNEKFLESLRKTKCKTNKYMKDYRVLLNPE